MLEGSLNESNLGQNLFKINLPIKRPVLLFGEGEELGFIWVQV